MLLCFCVFLYLCVSVCLCVCVSVCLCLCLCLCQVKKAKHKACLFVLFLLVGLVGFKFGRTVGAIATFPHPRC